MRVFDSNILIYHLNDVLPLQQAARLLAYFDEIPLHEPIVQRTITLRQQSRIRLPDALIAATALHLGFPLITRNTRDFRAIKELIILNPFDA